MTRRVIIDTDPGLDDAIAILFALECGRFEVLGLTSVAGNIGIDRTTENAGRLLALTGRTDIPVAVGADRPLRRWGIDVIAIHGNDGLKGVALPPSLAAPLPDAVGWIAEKLAAEPAGSIDILALGPLTNIARLVAEHPEAAGNIGRLIVMGGTVHEPGNAGPRSEFNFASDPEAAAIVVRSGIGPTIVPLDVTRKVRASTDYVASLRGTPHGDAAADLLTAYLQDGRQSRPLHDPCVMLLALDSSLFRIETLRIAIDLGDDADAGAIIVRDGGMPAQIALGVDVDRALALLQTGFV